MTGSFERFLAAILLVVAAPLSLIAEEPAHSIDPLIVIEQFDIYNDGDQPLVPVAAFGETRMFAFDTGSSHMAYDKSLRPFLGKPLRNAAFRTLAGKTDFELFESPRPWLGRISLHTSQEVGCHDFGKLNRWDGHPTEGIVGMAALRDYIVHLDFDAGKLSFLLRTPEDAGERFQAIFWRGIPAINVEISRSNFEPFLIDTGLVSDDAGDINGQVANFLTHDKLAEFDDSATVAADISGEVEEVQSVRIKRMKLGSHAMVDIPMSIGTGNSPNVLGLAFLSRFNITFDFPNRAIYLKKNKNFDRPYRSTSPGVIFARDNAGVVVDRVREGSPTAAAGIRIKDIVLKIGDQDASSARLFKLYDEFGISGRTVHVTLLRDGEIIETDVKLPGEDEKVSEAQSKQRSRR